MRSLQASQQEYFTERLLTDENNPWLETLTGQSKVLKLSAASEGVCACYPIHALGKTILVNSSSITHIAIKV